MCPFFRLANTEFQIEDPMKYVPATRFQKVDVEPFTREEVARMLKACTYSREADTSYRRQFVMRGPTANRDQAVILTLLDSCVSQNFVPVLSVILMRSAGNWKFVTVSYVAQKVGRVGRVYLGKTARHPLRCYLAEWEDGEEAGAPLFVARQGRPFVSTLLKQGSLRRCLVW